MNQTTRNRRQTETRISRAWTLEIASNVACVILRGGLLCVALVHPLRNLKGCFPILIVFGTEYGLLCYAYARHSTYRIRTKRYLTDI
jgi:hypothetical protein